MSNTTLLIWFITVYKQVSDLQVHDFWHNTKIEGWKFTLTVKKHGMTFSGAIRQIECKSPNERFSIGQSKRLVAKLGTMRKYRGGFWLNISRRIRSMHCWSNFTIKSRYWRLPLEHLPSMIRRRRRITIELLATFEEQHHIWLRVITWLRMTLWLPFISMTTCCWAFSAPIFTIASGNKCEVSYEWQADACHIVKHVLLDDLCPWATQLLWRSDGFDDILCQRTRHTNREDWFLSHGHEMHKGTFCTCCGCWHICLVFAEVWSQSTAATYKNCLVLKAESPNCMQTVGYTLFLLSLDVLFKYQVLLHICDQRSHFPYLNGDSGRQLIGQCGIGDAESIRNGMTSSWFLEYHLIAWGTWTGKWVTRCGDGEESEHVQLHIHTQLRSVDIQASRLNGMRTDYQLIKG